MPQAFNRPIVEIQVRHFERGGAGNAREVALDGKSVILRGNEHVAAAYIANRMVPASMAVRQFHGRATEREPDELMAEADSERREPGGRKLAD
jgi:hypothetical protein